MVVLRVAIFDELSEELGGPRSEKQHEQHIDSSPAPEMCHIRRIPRLRDSTRYAIATDARDVREPTAPGFQPEVIPLVEP
ncbi:hypothetical protein GCM10009764_51270 [Nocardia ninae]|uniref:Uncharacterized protein n=1 Tax=Nocardia ninae NBRC 108245 TaxID=1210091 RepID=A0A511M5V5_9NOCA|nr:hypothetical protein NN4_05180 [Nocardia ninae NBRC 108245]